MPNVLVPIAEGTEDLEVVTIIDLMRRAGFMVSVVSVMTGEKLVKCARGTRIMADFEINDASLEEERWDAIALPGGMPGAEYLGKSTKLINLLRKQNRMHRTIAAICAAPVVVLERNGLIGGRNATCFPGMENELMTFKRENVVADRELITSQGPATAIEFCLKIINHLGGKTLRDRIATDVLFEV